MTAEGPSLFLSELFLALDACSFLFFSFLIICFHLFLVVAVRDLNETHRFYTKLEENIRNLRGYTCTVFMIYI